MHICTGHAYAYMCRACICIHVQGICILLHMCIGHAYAYMYRACICIHVQGICIFVAYVYRASAFCCLQALPTRDTTPTNSIIPAIPAVSITLQCLECLLCVHSYAHMYRVSALRSRDAVREAVRCSVAIFFYHFFFI